MPSEALDETEKEEVDQLQRPRALLIHEVIRAEGNEELERPATSLFWSGIAAGLSMGASLFACAAIRTALPDAKWAPLVVALGYPVGFLVVILGRQQLFTENTLTPVLPLLHERDKATLGKLLRLWAIVFVSNMIGACAVGLAAAKTAILSPEVKASCVELGREVVAGGPGEHFLRAIAAGWLIALVAWLMPGAESARFWVIAVLTYLIGALHLSHVVAGTVEVAGAVAAGAVPVGEALGHFFVPALLGNTLGGVALVAALGHAQTVAEHEEEAKKGVRSEGGSESPSGA